MLLVSRIVLITQIYAHRNKLMVFGLFFFHHLAHLTVDFDEELSALFGGVLDDQSIYLELCIKTVLNLYKNLPNPPTSVSIVAHSMVCMLNWNYL